MGHIQFRSQLLQNQHFGVSILSFRGWRFFVSFKKEPCFTRALRRRSLQARILCRAQARRLRLQAQVNKKEIYVPQKIQGWNGWLEQKSDKCDLYTPFPGSLAQPLKFCHSKRKVVFEPSFFRGYVKLRGSIYPDGFFVKERKFFPFTQSYRMYQLGWLNFLDVIHLNLCAVRLWCYMNLCMCWDTWGYFTN